MTQGGACSDESPGPFRGLSHNDHRQRSCLNYPPSNYRSRVPFLSNMWSSKNKSSSIILCDLDALILLVIDNVKWIMARRRLFCEKRRFLVFFFNLKKILMSIHRFLQGSFFSPRFSRGFCDSHRYLRLLWSAELILLFVWNDEWESLSCFRFVQFSSTRRFYHVNLANFLPYYEKSQWILANDRSNYLNRRQGLLSLISTKVLQVRNKMLHFSSCGRNWSKFKCIICCFSLAIQAWNLKWDDKVSATSSLNESS